jgi:hypothetical protein
MTESDYWSCLEFRVSGEFYGMPQNHFRFRWCDGFDPQFYLLEGPSPRIIGRAWICNDQDQENWEFTLFLDAPVASRSAIDWASLLPPRDVTRWLAIDIATKRIQIEPSAAVPDPA